MRFTSTKQSTLTQMRNLGSVYWVKVDINNKNHINKVNQSKLSQLKK